METKKEEAIRKAYGEYWEQVKDYIDQYGRLTYQQCWDIWDGDTDESNFYSNVLQDKTIDLQDDYEGYYQPKSLQGIDDNRGWIRIESEEDLPKESGDYWVYETNGAIDIRFYLSGSQKWGEHEMEIEEPRVTHFQPIVKPKPPIY